MEQKDQQPLDMQETGLGGKMAHIIMSSPGVLFQSRTGRKGVIKNNGCSKIFERIQQNVQKLWT